jgi:hypothetical protein
MTYSLFYLARPIYGGWITFTSHLSLKENWPVYKIRSNTEKTSRDFGYGVRSRNLSLADAISQPRPLITAIDKTHYSYLSSFPEGTLIVIHDPTELKEELLLHLHRFRVITIRESVKQLLQQKHNITSTFILHPFYEYTKTSSANKEGAIVMSRIDFDKNIDIVLTSNIPVDIYGFANRIYVHHKLKHLGFDNKYKGQFKKSFEEVNRLLKDKKFAIDLSTIKDDGGGSQYSFLEAMYHGCCLVLHKKWLDKQTVFADGLNCFAVDSAEELEEVMKKEDISQTSRIGSYFIQPHLNVDWAQELSVIQ